MLFFDYNDDLPLSDPLYSNFINPVEKIDRVIKLFSALRNPSGMFHLCVYKISGLFFIGIVFLLIGCTAVATDRRKEGFDALQRGFNSIPETPEIHEVVVLKEVKVHIVGSRKLFNWNVAAAFGSPVAAYANTENEIWIIGKMVKGKIIVNQAILGHELEHLLNFKENKVANPDELDALGN